MTEVSEFLGSLLADFPFDPNLSPYRLSEDIDRIQRWHERVRDDIGTIQELAAENLELKLRLALLVRLLISKGIITAEEYAQLIAQFRSVPTPPVAPATAT